MPAASLDVGPGGEVGVVWTSAHEDDTHNVYFAQSTNGGASFGTNVRVHPFLEGVQEFPDVALDDEGRRHVIWGHADAPDWDYDLHYAFSDNGGTGFTSPVRVNDDPEEETHAQDSACLARGATFGVHAAWVDGREPAGPNIYFAAGTQAMDVAGDADGADEPDDADGAHGDAGGAASGSWPGLITVWPGPNPVWHVMHLPADAISVHDVGGRVMWSRRQGGSASHASQLGLDRPLRLEPGVYFVRWGSDDEARVGKVTVVH